MHLTKHSIRSPSQIFMMTPYISWWLLVWVRLIIVALSSTIIAIEFEKWRNCWCSNELTHFSSFHSFIPMKSEVRWKCSCSLWIPHMGVANIPLLKAMVDLKTLREFSSRQEIQTMCLLNVSSFHSTLPSLPILSHAKSRICNPMNAMNNNCYRKLSRGRTQNQRSWEQIPFYLFGW